MIMCRSLSSGSEKVLSLRNRSSVRLELSDSKIRGARQAMVVNVSIIKESVSELTLSNQ